MMMIMRWLLFRQQDWRKYTCIFDFKYNIALLLFSYLLNKNFEHECISSLQLLAKTIKRLGIKCFVNRIDEIPNRLLFQLLNIRCFGKKKNHMILKFSSNFTFQFKQINENRSMLAITKLNLNCTQRTGSLFLRKLNREWLHWKYFPRFWTNRKSSRSKRKENPQHNRTPLN